MKQILFPDHTAAISGVTEFLQEFADANDMQAVPYALAALQHLLVGKDDASTVRLSELLQQGPPALFTVPTTVRIDEALFRRTQAEAFATASTGTDHVEADFLEKNGLPYFSAPGENALSVVEYVLAALPLLLGAERLLTNKAPLELGIIGYGRIGSRLGAVAQRLGWTVRAYDPPLFHSTQADLDAVLQSDVITFHVPLTKQGPHATQGMIQEAWLDRARSSAIWINAARGPIVSEELLLKLCGRFRTIMDVFPVEPASAAALQSATIVSPHVAGYSWQARFAGVYRVLRDFAASRGLRMPNVLEHYRPRRFDESGLTFLPAESAALKANVSSFADRRNHYPSRSSFRDLMSTDSGLDERRDIDRSSRLYFGRLFEIWNELHLY